MDYLKQSDKWFHFLAGIAAAFTFALFFGMWVGMIAAIVVGIAKEAFDMDGRGTPDIADAMATIVGGAYVTTLIYIKYYL